MSPSGVGAAPRQRHGAKEAAAAAANDYRVYSRPLQGGDVAVALLNTNSFAYPRNITFTFKEVREIVMIA